MSRYCSTKRWPIGCLFQIVIIGVGPKRIFTFKIECSPEDQREPVLTIMMSDEDILICAEVFFEVDSFIDI